MNFHDAKKNVLSVCLQVWFIKKVTNKLELAEWRSSATRL